MRSVLRFATVAAAAVAALSVGAPTWADSTVSSRLQAVNDSGVRGVANLTARDDGSLRVVLRGTGYVPGQPHAQHIHGSLDGGHFMCPSRANDTDGDGVITNEEGTGEYGAVFLALTTKGDTSPRSGLVRMPVADASGTIDYRRTIPAAEVPDALLDNLSDVHIIQHGIDVNGNDRYDLAALGASTFAERLGRDDVPEEATNPAACGIVVGGRAAIPPLGGVETGGGEGRSVDAVLAGAGGALILLSVLVLVRRPGRVREVTGQAAPQAPRSHQQ